MQRQGSGKDLGTFKENSSSDTNCLRHRIYEEVVNQLLGILAMSRFSTGLPITELASIADPRLDCALAIRNLVVTRPPSSIS